MGGREGVWEGRGGGFGVIFFMSDGIIFRLNRLYIATVVHTGIPLAPVSEFVFIILLFF